VLETGDDRRCHHQRDQRRSPHVSEELATAQVQMAEDDQVGEVRTREEQGAGIRKQQAAVEKWCLALATTASRIDKDRGEKRHGGVEVQ
jgi:hypothetical protein